MNGTARAHRVRLLAVGVRRPHRYADQPAADSPPPTTRQPGPGRFWGDTSNIPAAQNVLMVKVLNRTNGHYPDSQVYWSFNGQTHSIAEQPYLDMPANSAGRMYFYLGSPTSQYFDFIEFTVGAGGLQRQHHPGRRLRPQAGHAPARARRLRRAGRRGPGDVRRGPVGRPSRSSSTRCRRSSTSWPRPPAPFRIIAPGSDPSFRAGGVNANYFTAYAQRTASTPRRRTSSAAPGVLAADPGRCAALNRHVDELPQSHWSTPSLYYQAAPANYYAKFWHDHAINKLAYGFPYDDYAGQSSFISHGNPQWLHRRRRLVI